MDVYLLRHGIAEDARPGTPDSDRALTREGRDKLRRVLKRVHEAGVAPTLILSSPYRRALETAEIAAEAARLPRQDRPRRRARSQRLSLRCLGRNPLPRDEDAILLASHEPLMSSLLAHLLGAPGLQTDFKKGAIARVACTTTGPAPRCVLKWLLTPALA